AAHRPQQSDLDQRTEQRSRDDRDDEAEKEIEAERRNHEIDGIGAEGVELAMSEINHAHDAEDQRQSDAEQGVGTAEHDGIEEMLEEFVHVPLTGPDAAGAGYVPASRSLAQIRRDWNHRSTITRGTRSAPSLQRGRGSRPKSLHERPLPLRIARSLRREPEASDDVTRWAGRFCRSRC